MDQLSFYSAEAREPAIADLAGMLCGPGQAVGFGRGTAARLSVVVDAEWRARALVEACAERGVDAQLGRSDEGHPLVRTAFRADLTGLAATWLRGAVKSVPPGYVPDGAALRIWALTAGSAEPGGYRLGLDPHAPGTHAPLAAALLGCGLPTKAVGPRAGGPALRVTGRRRLARLAELVGPTPDGAIERTWPLVS
ncbi:hypothetical protein HNR68_000369 [Saccharopolyspora hordei]|uniref:Uncharacterized protein n=1 Tax=Saccharopolyspora hordei TaxID=1838 RepID=A0A853AF75_9PSEU|nr:hypothetical protein [Saccharopolyspora hordei]